MHGVAVFHPLKDAYRKAVNNWLKVNGLNMKLTHFPEILAKGWGKSNSISNIKSGFRATGLWPLNLNWVAENKFKLKIHNRKSQLEKFEIIFKQHLQASKNGLQGLVKDCDYLNLEVSSNSKKLRMKKSALQGF